MAAIDPAISDLRRPAIEEHVGLARQHISLGDCADTGVGSEKPVDAILDEADRVPPLADAPVHHHSQQVVERKLLGFDASAIAAAAFKESGSTLFGLEIEIGPVSSVSE